MPLIHSMQINPCKCGTDKVPNFDSDDMVPCWAVQCYVCKQFVHDTHWTMKGTVNKWNNENPIIFKEIIRIQKWNTVNKNANGVLANLPKTRFPILVKKPNMQPEMWQFSNDSEYGQVWVTYESYSSVEEGDQWTEIQLP